MKRAIFPLIGAVAMLLVFINVNSQPTAAGYILAVGMGFCFGLFINYFVFKDKSKQTTLPNQTPESDPDESPDAKSA